MEPIENRIITYLNLIYQLEDEDKEDILLSLEKIGEEEKAKILMIVYKRYKDFISNAKKLSNNIRLASNNIREFREKNEANRILEKII